MVCAMYVAHVKHKSPEHILLVFNVRARVQLREAFTDAFGATDGFRFLDSNQVSALLS